MVKSFFYAKDPYESKYQCLIKKRGEVGLKHLLDPKGFIEYSNGLKRIQFSKGKKSVDRIQ